MNPTKVEEILKVPDKGTNESDIPTGKRPFTPIERESESEIFSLMLK